MLESGSLWRAYACCVGVAAGAGAGVAGESMPLHPLEPEDHAHLERIGELAGASSGTLTEDGAYLALARIDDTARGPASRIEIRGLTGGEARTIELDGSVRDLLFDADGTLLVLIERIPRRGPAVLSLHRFEPAESRPVQTVRVPPTTRAIEHWPAESSLLLACENEIRTVLLPSLRSSRLFRVPGHNLSLARIGDNGVVVGRLDALLHIELTDPPGREEMTVRRRAPAPGPVVDLAIDRASSRGLVRLKGGRLLDLDLSTLELRAVGEGRIVSRSRSSRLRRATASPSRLSETEEPAGRPRIEPVEPAPAVIAETIAEEPRPEPVEPDPPLLAVVPADADPVVEPVPSDVAAPAAPRAPEPETDPGETEPTLEGQVAGRLSGPDVSRVVAVVALGPDSVLRVAARARPNARGEWRFDGLAPGRYRIQLDAGGKHAVAAKPPIHVIRLDDGSIHRVDFRDVRLR